MTRMEISFDCECGEELSTFTRGGGEVDFRYECDDCGAVYAVSITTLSPSQL